MSGGLGELAAADCEVVERELELLADRTLHERGDLPAGLPGASLAA